MSEKNSKIANNEPVVVTHYEFPYMRKPKEKSSVWRKIYNRDKNYFLGRTPKNWGSLLVFYTIFYSVLAALFAICMQGLFANLSDMEPRWQLDSSRIGTNPGLGFRPISENVNRGSLIWYNAKDMEQVKYWSNLLEKFLEPYTNKSNLVGGGLNQVHCDFKHPPGSNQACSVDINNWGDCSVERGFSYNRSAPCIFLKLNRIFNWIPEYYDDINALPEAMPDDLKEYIKSVPESERQQVWVSCNGENPSDREHLGPVKYIPKRGFPSYFYPFTNVPGYLSPLIAVQLERPSVNRIINVECRAWAKNIIYNGSFRDRQGSIHFELMID